MRKVALITASSAGVGAAIARAMVSDMNVVLNYSSNESRANALMQELLNIIPQKESSNDDAEHSPRVIAFRADIGKPSGINELVSAAIATHGRLDVVISNGGWTAIRDFDSFDDNLVEDDWDTCFDINVKSHLWLMKAVLPHLEVTQGVFITMASVAGVKPSGSSVPYAVTKAAQIHLVKCLARITSPKVRVNSVSPGILMTDWGRRFPSESLERAKEATALKRFATVEDVAIQVRALACSQTVTGQNIVVDSGFSL